MLSVCNAELRSFFKCCLPCCQTPELCLEDYCSFNIRKKLIAPENVKLWLTKACLHVQQFVAEILVFVSAKSPYNISDVHILLKLTDE